MDASTSTDDLPAAAAPTQDVQAVVAEAPREAPQEAHVHIHLELDTDAGLARARALLSGLFQSTTGAALPAGPGQPSAPEVPAPEVLAPAAAAQASAPGTLASFRAPAIPAATPPPVHVVQQAALPANPMPETQPLQAAMNLFLQQPQQANLLQHLFQNATPRRRPGRPSRADTELRNLLAAVQPQPVQPAQQQQPQQQPQQQVINQQVQTQMICRLCNQPRADSILRGCGHIVCRVCVLPFLQLRPVCPVAQCNRPTTTNDVIHCT